MTSILGISAFFHDSAAALVVDGEIIAAAEEERFTRKKHDASFPEQSIEYCLSAAGLRPEQVDFVGFYEKPLLKFERLLETYVAFAPRGFNSFARAIPAWLKKKLYMRRELDRGLKHGRKKRYIFTEHHESHAASAFFPSPFESAAILTVDGVGEWATATYGVGRGNRISLSHEIRFPHSPGLLYSAFTAFCGFRVNSGEYKLMGLAPFGEPKYVNLIFDKLIDVKQDGSFHMDLSYFNYCHGHTMTSRKFDRLFGMPPRPLDSPTVDQRYSDMAASIQRVLEEIMFRMALHVHRETKMQRLCLAGGVALNCVANGKIMREGPFDELWIQPAAGDSGGALGVAQFIWYQLLNNPRIPNPMDAQHGSFLGPSFGEPAIIESLDRLGAGYEKFPDDDSLCDYVAQLLAAEKVVGWFQGRMEFGPRGLGARSILGDARSPHMQSTMNQKIKLRESFRPFAPSVLAERAECFFDLPPEQSSPYMLLVASVAESKRITNATHQSGSKPIEKVRQQRSVIPAVTHVDYSARVQTVDRQRHGRFHHLLKRFESLTGTPVMVNTSFNVRGEPIVCTPEQAYRCFMATEMDALVLERIVLLKERQATQHTAADQKRFLAGFTPD